MKQFENNDYIKLAEDGMQWRADVKAVMNLRFLKEQRKPSLIERFSVYLQLFWFNGTDF
jgi:hypothetical protein